ncbi:FAD-binding protein [Bacillus aerolatus]|uniref:L-aspartate oxidase n=1 Tax=Bacillus aerolatus TaxID=2653354 RepID=A0A6I1FFZ1_9BACI|nr:FAD-binding protein [Bacillus aerolatus]KAB7704250.1 FAD-binding protein [Bacillus aerolatus]
MVKISRKIRTDILVVGSGLSGIKVSKELADQQHHVLLATKMKVASGSSFYPLKASLGTQVSKDKKDEQTFLSDIEDLSRGMHRQDLAEVYVQEIPERVKEYKDIGVNAKKLEGERKACFAPHSRDIYLLSDWDQIRENVREIFSQYDHLAIMEKTVVITLIKKEQRIVGALLLDEKNELVLVECKAAILATGGFGSIYKHNLNPNDVDGSGHILALEAGASLVNMEFIQFIPGITTPRYKTLFGEHTLMYCHDIVGENGESLLDSFLPEGLSKKECLEIRSTHGPFTHSLESKYFDIAMMKQIISSRSEKGFQLLYDEKLYENQEEFYTVYLNWLKEKNVHLIENEIRITPFAHASNGGVYIDIYGRTGVEGLYAIGELSCNIEGANRLGGNSTGACMVFGKRAAVHCGEYVRGIGVHEISEDEGHAHLEKLFGANGKMKRITASVSDSELKRIEEQAHHIIDKIKEVMWYYGNVVRTEKQLTQALQEISSLELQMDVRLFFQQPASRRLAIKAKNFIKLSQILLQAMLERKESRGAHYREDHPHEDPAFEQRLFVSESQTGTMQFTFLNQ